MDRVTWRYIHGQPAIGQFSHNRMIYLFTHDGAKAQDAK
jgi:hypothetical protein